MFLMNETAITNDRMSVWSKILYGCVVFVLCFVHDIKFAPYYVQSKSEKSKFQLPALCLSFQVFLNNSLFVTESTSLSEKHRLNRAKLSRNLKLINRANIVNRKLTYLTDQHRNKCIIMPYHFSLRQLKAHKVIIIQPVQSALFCAAVPFIPNQGRTIRKLIFWGEGGGGAEEVQKNIRTRKNEIKKKFVHAN